MSEPEGARRQSRRMSAGEFWEVFDAVERGDSLSFVLGRFVGRRDAATIRAAWGLTEQLLLRPINARYQLRGDDADMIAERVGYRMTTSGAQRIARQHQLWAQQLRVVEAVIPEAQMAPQTVQPPVLDARVLTEAIARANRTNRHEDDLVGTAGQMAEALTVERIPDAIDALARLFDAGRKAALPRRKVGTLGAPRIVSLQQHLDGHVLFDDIRHFYDAETRYRDGVSQLFRDTAAARNRSLSATLSPRPQDPSRSVWFVASALYAAAAALEGMDFLADEPYRHDAADNAALRFHSWVIGTGSRVQRKRWEILHAALIGNLIAQPRLNALFTDWEALYRTASELRNGLTSDQLRRAITSGRCPDCP